MRKYLVVIPTIAVLLVVSAALGPVHGAQVVTEAARQWAREAASQEASLDIKPAADTVAVLYFQNRTNRPDLDFLQKGMTIMLITDLAKVEDLKVVERSRLQALVQEMRLGDSGIVARDSAPRVGNLLGAGYLVGGDFTPDQADGFKIDSNLLDVPEKALLGAPSSNGDLNALLRMEKEILFDLVRLLQIELTEEQEAQLRKPITTDLKALMFLVRGVDSSDQGAYAQAAEYYQQALALDPDLEPAKAAILELKNLRLIPAGPGTDAMLRKLRKRVSVNKGPVADPIARRRNSEPASVQGPAGAAEVDVRLEW